MPSLTITISATPIDGGIVLTFGHLEAPQKRRTMPPTILFTGFKSADRARLEELATKSKLLVRKTVTSELTLLVAGYNAGPAKLTNAKNEGATILTESQFMKLLDTGELPL